ncbi:MAG: 4-alpha-glucanotransferase, partial [Nitrospiraceae bacterium]
MEHRSEQELLDELAARFGIDSDYHDIFGQRHVTTSDTKRAILDAMGVEAGTAEGVARELAASCQAVWRTPCDPVLVRRVESVSGTWPFRMPAEPGEDHAVRIQWTIQDEHGRDRLTGEAGPGLTPVEIGLVEDQRYIRIDLPLPAGLEVGYYELAATASIGPRRINGRLRLILTPERCYAPPQFEESDRLWGLSLQLYALRSPRNWGVGDFGDLSELLQWAAKDLGVGMIGLNPLHALENSRPYHISPYSPDSRLFLNILYLDLERIPEWSECAEARQMLEHEQFRSQLETLREHETIHYEQVYAAKRKILKMLFTTFLERHCELHGNALQARTARGREFECYVREEGELLKRFAVFHALSETLQGLSP